MGSAGENTPYQQQSQCHAPGFSYLSRISIIAGITCFNRFHMDTAMTLNPRETVAEDRHGRDEKRCEESAVDETQAQLFRESNELTRIIALDEIAAQRNQHLHFRRIHSLGGGPGPGSACRSTIPNGGAHTDTLSVPVALSSVHCRLGSAELPSAQALPGRDISSVELWLQLLRLEADVGLSLGTECIAGTSRDSFCRHHPDGHTAWACRWF